MKSNNSTITQIKKVCIFLCALIMVITSLCACGHNDSEPSIKPPNCGFDQPPLQKSTMQDTTSALSSSDVPDITTNASSINAAVVMDALNVKDKKEVDTIINALNTISAGNIISATPSTENGEKVLDIVSENGAKYRFYLTKSLTVEAVKNTDTGEWVITSER